MDDFAISSDSYYFTATACNLLILTQAAVSTMKTNDPVIYQKIKRNLREISKNTVSERVRTEGEDSRARMDTQKSESIFEEYKLNNSNLGELERKVLELSELISIMKFKKD